MIGAIVFALITLASQVAAQPTAAPAFPYCFVCGETAIVSSRDTVVTVPGFNATTCAQMEQSGINGVYDSANCDAAQAVATASCGCTEQQNNFTYCNVCGTGAEVTEPNNTISLPGSPTLPCSLFAQRGKDGFIDPRFCTALIPFVVGACGCTDIPSPGYPSCDVCGEGFTVTNENNIVNVPGYEPLTCAEFRDAGLEGFIPENTCPFIVSLTVNLCGCKEVVGDFTPCNVCGGTDQVTALDTNITLPDGNQTTCEAYSIQGNKGFIEDTECEANVALVQASCACEALELTDPPTSAPTPVPTSPPTSPPTPPPTPVPTSPPTISPVTDAPITSEPVVPPTPKPTRKPTRKPTKKPVKKPTRKPTKKPVKKPTRNPTRKPVKKPTRKPTKKIVQKPTRKPTRKAIQ